MKQEKNNKVIDRYRDRVKPENKIYIRKNLQISERVSELLEGKGWSQKEFARRLGKKESEVSKWLSGLHNLTLKSITKMEAVLEEDIIQAPVLAREIDHHAPQEPEPWGFPGG